MALNGSPAAAYRVGVTGHRHLRAPHTVAARCHETLAGILSDRPDVVACSALAIGADSLFAQAALDLGIPLIAVIPFATYASDFTTPDERAQYERLLVSAVEIVRLPYRRRSDAVYLAAGQWIVEHCDLLIAVWNGQFGDEMGGTSDIVALATAHRLPVEWIRSARATASPTR